MVNGGRQESPPKDPSLYVMVCWAIDYILITQITQWTLRCLTSFATQPALFIICHRCGYIARLDNLKVNQVPILLRCHLPKPLVKSFCWWVHPRSRSGYIWSDTCQMDQSTLTVVVLRIISEMTHGELCDKNLGQKVQFQGTLNVLGILFKNWAWFWRSANVVDYNCVTATAEQGCKVSCLGKVQCQQSDFHIGISLE